MEPETYVYEKNRRYTVEAGTRCARVEIMVNTENSLHRQWAADGAARMAVAAWEEKWGPVPWSLASALVTHTTLQVIVEFRVEAE